MNVESMYMYLIFHILPYFPLILKKLNEHTINAQRAQQCNLIITLPTYKQATDNNKCFDLISFCTT